MSINKVGKSSSGAPYLIVGAVLLLFGIIGIVIYSWPTPNSPAEGDATADGVAQSMLVIGAAVATGVGLVLLAIGFIRQRRRNIGANDRSADSLEPPAGS